MQWLCLNSRGFGIPVLFSGDYTSGCSMCTEKVNPLPELKAGLTRGESFRDLPP